jgi:hypothetical protein
MELSKLKGPERTAAIGGVVLLVASFLPWYSVVGFGVSGWNSGGLAVLGVISGLVGIGVLMYAVFQDSDFRLGSFAAPQLALMAAALSAVLILLRLFTSIGNTSIGLYAGLVGAGVIAYGSFGAVKASGLEVPFVGGSDDEESE